MRHEHELSVFMSVRIPSRPQSASRDGSVLRYGAVSTARVVGQQPGVRMASGLLVQQAWPNVRLESDRTNIEAMSEKIKSLEDDRMRLRGELEQLSTEKHTLEATIS